MSNGGGSHHILINVSDNQSVFTRILHRQAGKGSVCNRRTRARWREPLKACTAYCCATAHALQFWAFACDDNNNWNISASVSLSGGVAVWFGRRALGGRQGRQPSVQHGMPLTPPRTLPARKPPTDLHGRIGHGQLELTLH